MKKTGKDVKCMHCAREFYASGWELRTGRGKFCSMTCKGKYMKNQVGEKAFGWKGGKVTRMCLNCAREFHVYPSRAKRGRGVFCSRKCKDQYQTTLTGEDSPGWKGGPKYKRKCEICGKDFGLYSEKTNAKGRFCSKGCMVVWQRTLIQEKANQWKGGLRKPRKRYPGGFSEYLRDKIRERDAFTCQGCGLTNEEHKEIYKGHGLHVHHIDSDVNNLDESNLVTVCCQCNNRARFNKDHWVAFYTNNLKVRGLL